MSLRLRSAQRWGCCPPFTREVNNLCACLPWKCLSSWKCLFWGWAGVRRCLYLKILKCVFSLSFLLASDFYHFSLLVPPQLNTELVCHLPAVLTCRCCFPALRETKLFGFCSTRCWRLCNFCLCFLARFALGAFLWWLGLFVVLPAPSMHLASCSSSSTCTAHSGAMNTEKQKKISQTQIVLADDSFLNFILCPLLKSAISLLLFQNSDYPRRERAKTFTLVILIKSKIPFLRKQNRKEI